MAVHTIAVTRATLVSRFCHKRSPSLSTFARSQPLCYGSGQQEKSRFFSASAAVPRALTTNFIHHLSGDDDDDRINQELVTGLGKLAFHLMQNPQQDDDDHYLSSNAVKNKSGGSRGGLNLMLEEEYGRGGGGGCSSIDKAFSSMVFIIRELNHAVLRHQQSLLDRVQDDVHDSFLWLFRHIYSSTPTLMLSLMLILSTFALYSLHPTAAAAAADNVLDLIPPATAEPEHGGAYSRTEHAYTRALQEDPDSPLLLANFAQFLFLIRRDIPRAELYFRRAAGIRPPDAESLSRYANFLWVAKKDEGAAEEKYLEAITAEPGNTYYAAAYAHFLWNTGGEDTCYPIYTSTEDAHLH